MNEEFETEPLAGADNNVGAGATPTPFSQNAPQQVVQHAETQSAQSANGQQNPYANMTREELDAEESRIMGELGIADASQLEPEKPIDQMSAEELDAKEKQLMRELGMLKDDPQNPQPSANKPQPTVYGRINPAAIIKPSEAAAKGKRGAIESAALEHAAETGQDSDYDGTALGSVASAAKSFATSTTGGVFSKSANNYLQSLVRGVSRGAWTGEGKPLEEMPDSVVDYMLDQAGANGFAGIRAIFGGSASHAWRGKDNIMRQWDESEGLKYKNEAERKKARVEYAKELARGMLGVQEEAKLNAESELAGREETTMGALVRGLIQQGGYTAGYILGAPIAETLEGGARAAELMSDKTKINEKGEIVTDAKRDSFGTALAKGAARGVVAPLVELVGGKLVSTVGSKAISATIGKIPLVKKVGERIAATATGKAVAGFANKFNRLGRVTGLGSFPEEMVEEWEDQVLDAMIGLDRRESEKEGTTALGRAAESSSEFFTKKNMVELAKGMVLMQVLQGGAAHAIDRHNSRRVDAILEHVCMVDRDKIKGWTANQKQQAFNAWANNLSEEDVKQIVDGGSSTLDKFMAWAKGGHAISPMGEREGEQRMSSTSSEVNEVLGEINKSVGSHDFQERDADGKVIERTFTAPMTAPGTEAPTVAWTPAQDEGGNAVSRIADGQSGITIDRYDNAKDKETQYRVYDSHGRQRAVGTYEEAVSVANDMAKDVGVRNAKLQYLNKLSSGVLRNQSVFVGDTISDIRRRFDAKYGEGKFDSMMAGGDGRYSRDNEGKVVGASFWMPAVDADGNSTLVPEVDANGNPVMVKDASGNMVPKMVQRRAVFFALNGVNTIDELNRTAYHEVARHSGLAKMFEPEQKREFLKRLTAKSFGGSQGDEYISQVVKNEMKFRGYKTVDELWRDTDAVEEVFANLTENMTGSPTLKQKFMANVYDWYRRHHDSDLSVQPDELAVIVDEMNRFAREGGGTDGNGFTEYGSREEGAEVAAKARRWEDKERSRERAINRNVEYFKGIRTERDVEEANAAERQKRQKEIEGAFADEEKARKTREENQAAESLENMEDSRRANLLADSNEDEFKDWLEWQGARDTEESRMAFLNFINGRKYALTVKHGGVVSAKAGEGTDAERAEFDSWKSERDEKIRQDETFAEQKAREAETEAERRKAQNATEQTQTNPFVSTTMTDAQKKKIDFITKPIGKLKPIIDIRLVRDVRKSDTGDISFVTVLGRDGFVVNYITDSGDYYSSHYSSDGRKELPNGHFDNKSSLADLQEDGVLSKDTIAEINPSQNAPKTPQAAPAQNMGNAQPNANGAQGGAENGGNGNANANTSTTTQQTDTSTQEERDAYFSAHRDEIPLNEFTDEQLDQYLTDLQANKDLDANGKVRLGDTRVEIAKRSKSFAKWLADRKIRGMSAKDNSDNQRKFEKAVREGRVDPRTGKSTDAVKRDGPNARFSIDVYTEETGDLQPQEFRDAGPFFHIPNGLMEYRKALANWKRRKDASPANKPTMAQFGVADPMADWIDNFLDGATAGQKHLLFGFDMQKGANDGMEDVLARSPIAQMIVERNGGMGDTGAYEALAEAVLEANRRYSEWRNKKVFEDAENKAVDSERKESEAVWEASYDDLAAAHDAQNAEWESALGEIESADAFGPNGEYLVPFNRSNLTSAKRGDIIRLGNSPVEFSLESYDAESGVLTMAAEEDGKTRKFKVTENEVKEIGDGRNSQGSDQDNAGNAGGESEGTAGGAGQSGNGNAQNGTPGNREVGGGNDAAVSFTVGGETVTDKDIVSRLKGRLADGTEVDIYELGDGSFHAVRDGKSVMEGASANDVLNELNDAENNDAGNETSEEDGEDNANADGEEHPEGSTDAGWRAWLGDIELNDEKSRKQSRELFDLMVKLGRVDGRTGQMVVRPKAAATAQAAQGENLTLESVTPAQLEAERKRREQKAAIAERLAKPLKGSGPIEQGQSLLDLGGAEGGDLFNRVQTQAAPSISANTTDEELAKLGAKARAASARLGGNAAKSDAELREMRASAEKLHRGKIVGAIDDLLAYREAARRKDVEADTASDSIKNDESTSSDFGVRFRRCEDKGIIDEFNDETKTITLYRAVKIGPDGSIRPPQSSRIKDESGKYVEREPEGYVQPDGRITKNKDGTGGSVVMQADERFDLAYTKKNKSGTVVFTDKDVRDGKCTPEMVGTPKYYFDLKKGSVFDPKTGKKLKDGGSTDGVVYDPYGHFSDTPFNDQFSSAWRRPDWVVIRVKLLKSDLESGYRAKGAGLTVGTHPWNGGAVDHQLPSDMKRNVYLSRYWKLEDIVTDREAADILEQKWGGLKDSLEIPDNRVTPGMREEMARRGFNITKSGEVDYSAGGEGEGAKFRRAVTPAEDAAYMDAVKRGDMETAQRMVRERVNVSPIDSAKTGKPITVEAYRGVLGREYTPNPSFEAGVGIFLSSDEDVARDFTFPREWGELVTETYNDETGEYEQIEPGDLYHTFVEMNNPLVLDRDDRLVTDTAYQSDVLKKAKTDGYDGVVMKDVREGIGDHSRSTNIVVFNPSQVKLADPVTYDDAGNVIPLSRRFNPENPDIRFRRAPVTPAEDAAYMDAVKRGDAETAQRMVRESAAKAGYGTGLMHGTNNEFTEFKPVPFFGKAWFFTDNDGYAKERGANVKHVFVDTMNFASANLPIGRFSVPDHELGIIKKAKADGRDGVVINAVPKAWQRYLLPLVGMKAEVGGLDKVYVVFDGSKIKSADPVTYDDAGNVIPLSQRFNSENPDIRFRRYTPNLPIRRIADAMNLTPREADALANYAAALESGKTKADSMPSTERELIEAAYDPLHRLPKALVGKDAGSRWNAIRRGLQRRLTNYLEPVINMTRFVEGKTLRPVPTEDNVADAAKFASSHQRRMWEDAEREVMEPLEKEIAKNKLNEKANAVKDATLIHELLLALHGPAFNRMIAERTKGANSSGSGASTKFWLDILRRDGANGTDAELLDAISRGDYAGLNWAANSVGAKAAKAVALVRDLNNRTRDVLEKSGRLSSTQRQTWENLSPFYVPMRFDQEGDDNFMKVWLYGGTVADGQYSRNYTGPESRHATGHENAADDPIAFSLMQYSNAIQRATDNDVRAKLAKMVRAYPFLGEVIDPKNPQQALRLPHGLVLGNDTTLHSAMNINAMESHDNIVAFKENGDLKFIVLGPKTATSGTGQAENNYLSEAEAKLVGRAIKKTSLAKPSNLTKFIGKMTRAFSMARTTLSPEFLVSNFLADNAQAAGNLYASFGAKGIAQFEGGIPSAIASSFRMLRGKLDPARHAMDGYAKELRENGGLIGGIATENFDNLKRRIDADIERFAGKRNIGPVGMTAGFVKRLVRHIEDLNAPFEQATRLAAYATMRKQGKSIAEAAKYAREVTVDFNQKGEWTPVLNAFYAFSNASLVDMERSFGAYLAKRGTRLCIGLTALGFLASFLGYWKDDPDDEREGKAQWKDATDYLKQNKLGARLGGSSMMASVPIRGINRQFYHMGHMLYETLRGHTAPSEAALKTAGFALQNVFDPIGDASKPAQAVWPSVIRPGVELALNESFTGSQIYRQPMNRRTDVRSEMGRSNTPQMWKIMAKALNSATGGNRDKRGLVDVQPEIYQHVFSWLFGSVGNDAARMANIARDVATGDFSDLNVAADAGNVKNVPAVRRFVSALPSNSANYGKKVDEFTEDMRQFKDVAKEDPAVMADLRKRHPYFEDTSAAKRWRQELEDLEKAQKKMMKVEMSTEGDDRKTAHDLRMKIQAAFIRRMETAPGEDAQGDRAFARQRERETQRTLAQDKRRKELEKRNKR